MKAIRIARTGGIEVLESVEIPTPAPGPGEVLIRTSAIGVNFFDLMIRTGRYRWMPKLPFVPGNEAAGEIAALGAGASGRAVGDRVFVAGYDLGNRGGLYAEYVTAPAEAVWSLPDAIDFEAATALTNYQLAWLLMHRAARGVETRHVVIYGAAGGVGSALIDVARAAGAGAIGVAGGAAKQNFVASRGAIAIDHQTENVPERAKAATGGRGADIVFTHLAGSTLADGIKMLAPLGMVVSYAILAGMPETDLFKNMRDNLEASPAVRCLTMHTFDHWPEPRREAMAAAIALLARGQIKPAIAATLPLADAAKAHALLEARTAMGKVVLVP